jgi:opacity protein-like surface antigen
MSRHVLCLMAVAYLVAASSAQAASNQSAAADTQLVQVSGRVIYIWQVSRMRCSERFLDGGETQRICPGSLVLRTPRGIRRASLRIYDDKLPAANGDSIVCAINRFTNRAYMVRVIPPKK